MKYINFLFILSLFYFLLFPESDAQTFRGTLVYKFNSELNDEEILAKLASTGIQNPAEKMKNDLRTYLINDNILASIASSASGELRYKQLLDETKAITEFPNGQVLDFYNSSYTGTQQLVLHKKTNTFKEIKGYRCRKYEYENEMGRAVIVWIAVEIPIDQSYNQLPFFDKFFFEDGLVLEKTVMNPSGFNHWILEEIQFKDLSADEIISFFNTAR